MRRRVDLAALAFLAGAAALFFWPLWIAGYRFPRGGGDLWGQLYPVWSFVGEWVRQGVFPLWNFRIMGGDPMLAEAQYGLFNPLNWPLFLAHPLPVGLVLLRGTFSLWLAGAGTYLYLRRSPVWRLRIPAALVGALAFMLSDPFVAHLGHPQFNDVMAWLPWVLLGMDGAMRRARAIPRAAIPLALLLLAGHGQAALYALCTIGLYGAWHALEGGPQRGPRRAGRLALVALIGLALAMPSILPGMERLPLTQRALVPREARHGYEFPPAMLVDFLNPAFHGRGVGRWWAPWDRVESGYVGAVALYLALFGLLTQLRRRRTWALLLLGGLAYAFALGYRGWLYPPLADLPFFAESWKTARAIYLLSFALAIAAGLGVEWLLRASRRERFLAAGGLVVLALALWVAAPGWTAGVPPGDPHVRALAGLRLAALLAGGTALVAIGLSSGFAPLRAGSRAGLVLLLLGELVVVGALAEVEPPSRAPDPHAAAAEFLRADAGWFRVDVDVDARGLWSPSHLMAQGFSVPQGTGDPMELSAFHQFYWGIPHKGAPVYRLLGVKYIVVPKGDPPGGEGIVPVFVDDPLIDLHLHTGALPRVWLVYRTLPVAGIEEAHAVVFDPGFAPEQVATVEGGPRLEGAGSGQLELHAYTPHRVALRVQTSDPALLVLSDVHYPGWEAWVDGTPAPIYRADGVLRGVVVPAGDHRVEMVFRPRPLVLGAGLAAMGAWLLLVSRLRRVRRGGKRESA